MARLVESNEPILPIMPTMKHFQLIGILGVWLISTFSLNGRAELRPRNGLGFSLLGGFSNTQHRDISLGQISSQMGLTFGFGMDFLVLPEVSIEINLLNTQKNFEIMPSGGGRESYLLTYLEAPVMVKWWLSKNFQVKAGPYLTGLLIQANRESAGQSQPVKTEFNNDYGVTVGTWLGFQTKKNLLVGLDVRYDLGLADLRADNAPETSLYTRTLLTMLTFNFLF